jgi:radical SAM protein with 4Fe4S-binding SPASM domain
MNRTLSDQINFLSHWTPRRVFNAFKIGLSFYIARYTKKTYIHGSPVSVSIEPTTACNLGCPECPSGLRSFSRETGNLKENNFKNWIDQLYKNLVYINFYFQGEPFIHPGIFEMISYAKSKKIYSSTSTNAHFLTEAAAEKTVKSGLDRLIISIDGTTQEVYEQYRVNGQLSKVIEGTKNIVKKKKELQSNTPQIIFQFLVVKPNQHQIEDVKKMALDLGVDEVRFKTAQVYSPSENHPLIPTIEKYSRYRKNQNGTFSLKNKMENHCLRMWSSAVITWDGKVVPCCFDKDAKHQLGDLKNEQFQNIWKSPVYQSFRKQVFSDRKSIDICSNCSEGTKVWA